MNKLELLQNLSIDHEIILAKTNRLSLKYNRMGILIIRCPLSITTNELNEFITRHIKWIINHHKTSIPSLPKYEEGREYLYLGNTYSLEIVISRHEGVFLQNEGRKLIVYVYGKERVKDVLTKWKKDQAETVFNELFFKCFKDMEQDLNKYPKLSIKHYLSRWGCCYPKRNEIILNISLIHTEIEIIMFVIYHELTHLIVQNHQPAFHKKLQKYCPDEIRIRKKLKNYRTDYE